ncbi:MAG: NACHT domain-containing protein [Bryobacterales bacterium]|nr:NACHT domain-containing protein [Bryobacterales bacterium]
MPIVVYEILLFIRQFPGRFWKLRSGYERDYRKRVFYHCCNFDLKGLSKQGVYSLEMKPVFVEPSLAPDQADERGNDPFPSQSPAGAGAERLEVWEYLEKPGHFAIIGAPGSGKTTLLKHVATALAASRRKKVHQTLPVYLCLRTHAKVISENPDLSLQDVILASEAVKSQTLKPPPNWFERKLNEGKCLVLLDGLDEAGDAATRLKVSAWVEKSIQDHAGSRFLIASRPWGYYENPVPGVSTLRVLPFSEHQTSRFVSNWYHANEAISHNSGDEDESSKTRRGAAELMSRVRGSDVLTDLAANPLMLTMIATLHRYRGHLPGGRAELYRDFFEAFLGNRQKVEGARDEFNMTPDQKRIVLESLAYRLMSMRSSEIAAVDAAIVIDSAVKAVNPSAGPGDFLEMVENSSGLLLERERGVYSFGHKTFQEYLAAVHMRANRLERDLAAFTGEEWWHETIRLYVAEADATPILEGCLRHEPPSLPALTLLVECIQEAQKVDPAWPAMIASLITNSDPEHERIYGEAMFVIRRRDMAGIDELHAVDSRFVTNAEYQVFLDEVPARANDFRPDHWTAPRFSAGEGSRPVAVSRNSQVKAFGEWMTVKYGGRSWNYTIPSLRQLQDVAPHEPGQRDAQRDIGCWSTEGLAGGDDNSAKLRLAAEKLLQSLIRTLEANACARAVEIIRALAVPLALDRGRPRENARALVLARDAARESVLDLVLDLRLASGLSINLPGDLGLAAAHARAGDLDLDLDRARDRALDLDLDLVLDRARDLALDLARDLAIDHALDLDRALARFPVRDLARALDLALDIAVDRARALALHLTRELDLDRALVRDPAGVRDLARNTEADFLFFKKPAVAVRMALVNEMRKGTVVGGIRLARERRSGTEPSTAATASDSSDPSQ